jgi:nuclear pore complex protein Nup210
VPFFVDNMFSSLVGIQISWRFLYSESSLGTVTHCLVHVPLKNTALSDCGCICEDIDTRIELEEKVTVIVVTVITFC